MQTVLVTRPQPECDHWVTAIRCAGLDAQAVPLIDICLTPFAWDTGACYDAFMFVSRSAVAGFFKKLEHHVLHGARCMASGPGTAKALMDHSVDQQWIDFFDPQTSAVDALLDSESLWHIVGQRQWLGKRVCIVRGMNAAGQMEGRNWLAEQLQAAGAQVDFIATYQRTVPVWEKRFVASLAFQDRTWLFSSSQSLLHLKQLLPGHDWSRTKALATHPRIAEAAQGLGFASVGVCAPTLASVIQRLKT